MMARNFGIKGDDGLTHWQRAECKAGGSKGERV